MPLARLSPRQSLHACPHPECSRAVPGLMWACFEHWQALPPAIRQGIWAATRGPGPGSLQLQEAEQRAYAYWGAIEQELLTLAGGAPVGAASLEPPRATA